MFINFDDANALGEVDNNFQKKFLLSYSDLQNRRFDIFLLEGLFYYTTMFGEILSLIHDHHNWAI